MQGSLQTIYKVCVHQQCYTVKDKPRIILITFAIDNASAYLDIVEASFNGHSRYRSIQIDIGYDS